MIEDIKSTIENSLLRGLFTAAPGKVVNSDSFITDGTVDVVVGVNNYFQDGVELEQPVIHKVPLVMPSAGGGVLSFPVADGDTVLLIFSMFPSDTWLDSSGDNVTSPSQRHHSMTDCIAIPGLYPFSKHLIQSDKDVVLKFSDSSITIKSSGGVSIDSSSEVVVNSPKITMNNGSSGGVVCQSHVCAFTGGPHPQGSTTITGDG